MKILKINYATPAFILKIRCIKFKYSLHNPKTMPQKIPQASQLHCPKCNSKIIVKKGIRKNKLQTLQQYQCRECRFIFTINKSKNTTYQIQTILKAISNYNLGCALQQTKEKLNLQATLPAISSWLEKYKSICTFARLRKQAIRLYNPKNIIFKKPLLHQQIYI